VKQGCTCIVECDIEATVAIFNRCKETINVFRTSHVGFDVQRIRSESGHFLYRLFSKMFSARRNYDIRPFFCKGEGRCPPYT